MNQKVKGEFHLWGHCHTYLGFCMPPRQYVAVFTIWIFDNHVCLYHCKHASLFLMTYTVHLMDLSTYVNREVVSFKMSRNKDLFIYSTSPHSSMVSVFLFLSRQKVTENKRVLCNRCVIKPR